MSRFWAAGGSSSESESGSGSDSDESIQNQAQAGAKFARVFDDSDSDSDDEVRVVKSKKDKASDTILEIVNNIRNKRKVNDWSAIIDEFSKANEQVTKSVRLGLLPGAPKFYIRMLADLEDQVKETLKDKETIKKMAKNSAKALDRMKLVIKKHNEGFKDEIADFRANPEKYEEVEKDSDSSDDDSDDSSDDSSDEDSDESDSDDSGSSDEEVKKKPTKTAAAKKKPAGDDDSEEDSLFGDDDEDIDASSSEDDEDDDGRPQLAGRARWLKKPEKQGKEKKPTADVRKKRKDDERKEEEKKKKRGADAEGTVKKAQSTPAWVLEMNMTEEELDKKVLDLVAARGRKNTDPREVLRKLEVLSKIARVHGAKKEIPVLMHLISSMFDSQRVIDDYMDLQQWRTCFRSLLRVINLLTENKALTLDIIASEDVTDVVLGSQGKTAKKGAEEEEGVEAAKPVDKNVIRVVGSLESFILRLEDEYIKSLQQINPHTKDYVVRLADEASLIELSELIRAYYVRVKSYRAAAQVALLQIEHLYYKHDTIATAVQRAHMFNKTWGNHDDLHPSSLGKAASTVVSGSKEDFEGKTGIAKATVLHPASFKGPPSVAPKLYDVAGKIEELSNFIFKHGDDRSRTRALLCAVYHNALHDRFYRARDMFLISHIQDIIEKADTKTQILYNRALVTLGLSAFRLGLIQKAHDCLTGICSGRVRELLAQGQARWPDKDPEQEKIERRRQMPYHMHINPDLLDCCHLIAAMLLELPLLAKNSVGGSTNTVSRQFRKYFSAYSKQKFTGPPENTRDHVLAATKSLLSGEWKRALAFILNLEVWNLIPGEGGARVKEMLSIRLKEEALRTYLITYGVHYDSMSLGHLCTTFDMEAAPARRIISRMIFNKEISGAWEHQPPDTLVLYKVDPTPVQTLSLQVAEKVAAFVESNERMLDPLINVYGYKDDQRAKWGDRDNNRDGGDRRRGLGWKSSASKPNMRQPPRQGGGRGRGGRGDRRRGQDGTTAYRQQKRAEAGVVEQQQSAAPQQSTRRAGWGSANQ